MTFGAKTFIYARDHRREDLDVETREAVVFALLEWFHIWLPASFIDDENIAEGGQLAAGSKHADLDVAVLGFMRNELSSPKVVVAAAFLDGYWSKRAISPSFDLAFFAGLLDEFATSDQAFAATAIALYRLVSQASSLHALQSHGWLRERLLTVRGQLMAAGLFPSVLVYLNHLTTPGELASDKP